MADNPIQPPARKAVSEFLTPSPAVAFFTELVNRDDPAYYQNAPVKRGTLYSTIVGGNQSVTETYPVLYFLRERKAGVSDQVVFWDWATVPEAENAYNAEVNYVANAIFYPAFTRAYTIRRDVYDNDPTATIGEPLTALLGVEITNGGGNYTYATGTITGTDVDIEFVCANGEIISAVIKNEGSGVTPTSEIVITGDGSDAEATPITQSVSCILTAQQKQEFPPDSPLKNEFVRVIRTYETIPSPFITTTRIDKDGAIVTARTRRQVTDFITDNDYILNGEWVQTNHKGIDDFLSEEIVESRPLPGNPMVTTKIDQDGKVLTSTKTLVDTTTVISAETLIAGTWTKRYKEEVAATSFVKDSVASYKVSWQIVETRDIPGNPLPSTELDKDGMEIDVVRTMKDATTIVTNDEIVAGVWIRTNAEAITDLVSWEIVKARAVPGNVIPSSNIGADHETATVENTLKDATTITPGASESGGVITTIESREVSDLVSEEIVTDKPFLDEAFYSIAIPNVIPEIFRATIPTHVESHIVPGIAAEPNLGFGEFERSERQLTKLLKEVRFTVLDDLGSIPITITGIKETNQFKQVVTVTMILELDTTIPMSPDEFTDVEFRKLGNGLAVEIRRVIPNVYANFSARNAIPDTTPPEFRALIETHTAQQTFAGAPNSDPPLSTGQLSIEESQVTEMTFQRNLVSKDLNDLPKTLYEYESTPEQQQATISKTLQELAGFVPQPPSATVSSKSSNLGDGTIVEEIRQVPEVFTSGRYKTEIPNTIPTEFRPFIPTTTTSEESAGFADTTPNLGTGDLSKTEEQVKKFVKRVTTESFGSISLPITHTNNETTTEYGGGVLNANITLDTTGSQTIDEGQLVVGSEVRDLGNGMEIKQSKILDDSGWPLLTSTLWDENMRLEYTETQQVVAAGASPDPDPGGAVWSWTSEVRKLDKWRSIRINTSKPTPAYTDESTALITYRFGPYRFPGLVYPAAAGYYVRSSNAVLVQHLVKTWWEKSATTPVVAFDEIITDDPIISELNNTSALSYAGQTLHDDLLVFASLFYPATTPSFTEYTTNWIGNYKIIGVSVEPERDNDVWKITTQSVVMR